MSTIHEGLGNVSRFILDNLKTAKQPESVLVQSQQSYIDCLTIKHVELEQLLRKDEAHWVSEQDKARKVATQVSEKIAAMIEE